jgi:hypothetical protein
MGARANMIAFLPRVRRSAGIGAWFADLGRAFAFALALSFSSLASLSAHAAAQAPPPGTAASTPAPPVPSTEARPPQPVDQPITTALDVVAGATCLEEGPLETEVQTWLGHDRLSADLHVHVTGDERDARSVVFRIVRQGKTRERRFNHLPPDCEDATAVVALAIALSIDATVVPELARAQAGDDANASPSAPPERVFAAQVAAGYEVLPGASLGAAVGIEYGLFGWLSVRADALGQFSWSNSIQGATGVFDAVALAVAPQVCAGGPVAPRVRFELCSGAAAGLVHVQGRGYAVSRSATGSWIVASGGARVLFEAGISWALDVGGVFPLHVPAFQAQNGAGESVYRSPSAAGALLSVGPAFTF